MQIKVFFISTIFSLSIAISKAQLSKDTTVTHHSLSIKTNPIKPFIGIVGLGIEIQVSPHFSASMFGELLLKEKLMVANKEHPVFVLEISPRYYFKSYDCSGFYAGPVVGFTMKRKDTSEPQGLIAGTETGYKLFIGKQKKIFIEPKGLFLYNFDSKNLSPGIEGHIGIRL